MNQHAPRRPRPPTQAADGLPRWRWTLAEFNRFIELGILDEDDTVELIGGELVPMAAKGIRHENVTFAIEEWIAARRPGTLRVAIELGWRPDDDTCCEPDMLVIPQASKPYSKVPPAEVRLLVEVADTTLQYDTGTKAALYARLGIREVWVVNAETLETRVSRDPGPNGFGSIQRIRPARPLTASRVPDLSVRLMDLGLD